MRNSLLSFLALLLVSILPASAALADAEAEKPEDLAFSYDGFFGKYDKAQLRRGFQIYQEVCSACHSLDHVYFRHLEGLGFSEEEIAQIAESWPHEISEIDPESGEYGTRTPKPTDKIPYAFPNSAAAEAALGIKTPELSLIVPARRNGDDYLAAFLKGFVAEEELDGFNETLEAKGEHALNPTDGQYVNRYFPGFLIAMAPPLFEGAVEYTDGTQATLDQMAADVTAFLKWASDPHLEARYRTGIATILFLIAFTVLAYFSHRYTAKREKVRYKDRPGPWFET